MILDTTVLIDLQRELRRGVPGRASSLLLAAGDDEVAIGFITWMELAEGYADDHREGCELFLSRFRVLWPTTDTAWLAARVSRTMQREGTPIGDHDAWIAGLGLQHDRVVASRNNRHFGRVPGLSVRPY